jgi:hypothetical protein
MAMDKSTKRIRRIRSNVEDTTSINADNVGTRPMLGNRERMVSEVGGMDMGSARNKGSRDVCSNMGYVWHTTA